LEEKDIIIYIKPVNTSFVVMDQRILEKHYRVIPYVLEQNRGKIRYFKNLFYLIFFLFKNAFKSRAFVCWFGDYHAAVMVFMGKLTGIPSIVFAGGQEAVCYKELGKGVYLKKVRGLFVKYALRNCSMILPNHQSLMYHENYFYNQEHPHIDGINHYVGKIKGEVLVVPNGIDFSRIDRNPSIEKEPDLVLTVGTMNKVSDFYNKGYDLFIELARRCKNYRFIAVGVKKESMDWIEEKYRISEIHNLKVVPAYCPADVLSAYYNKAKVYLQISITEGMPNSLGEAMLCECIPVGSDVNGIPDAIGDCGIIIKHRDLDELEQALYKAMTMDSGTEARKHTIENFSFENREDKLIQALKTLKN
jgi:glycosyltransferase involved in cell wall biosynthesis